MRFFLLLFFIAPSCLHHTSAASCLTWQHGSNNTNVQRVISSTIWLNTARLKGAFRHCTLYLDWARTWMNHHLKSLNPSPFSLRRKLKIILEGELRRKYFCRRVRMWQADDRRELRPERSWIKHSQTATPRLIGGKAAFYRNYHRGVQHLWGRESFFHATRREALNVKCEEEQTERRPSAAVSSVQGQVKCCLQFVRRGASSETRSRSCELVLE